MPPVAIIAAAGLAVAAVGTVATISAQNKMAKAQQQQFKYQRSMDQYKAARDRTQVIRQARMSMGSAEQTAVNQGVQDTSASLGGIGSIQSQLQSSLSFLDVSNYMSDQASIQAGKAAMAEHHAQTASAIAGLGMEIFKSSGDISGAVFGK